MPGPPGAARPRGEGRRQHRLRWRPCSPRSSTAAPGVVLHAQDCISARAAARVRDAAADRVPVVRTVHHVDDFTSRVLHGLPARGHPRAGRRPGGHRGVARRSWRPTTAWTPAVVPNGVDVTRFAERLGRAARPSCGARVGAARPAARCWPSAGSNRARAATPGARAGRGPAGRSGLAPVLAVRRRALLPGLPRVPRRGPRPSCPRSGLRARPRRGARSAPCPTPTCPPGTAPPTRSPSRRSRRASGWRCSRR